MEDLSIPENLQQLIWRARNQILTYCQDIEEGKFPEKKLFSFDHDRRPSLISSFRGNNEPEIGDKEKTQSYLSEDDE